MRRHPPGTPEFGFELSRARVRTLLAKLFRLRTAGSLNNMIERLLAGQAGLDLRLVGNIQAEVARGCRSFASRWARLQHRIGQFLVLTGARLDGAECLWAGLTTHYLPAAALPEAKRRIAAAPGEIAAILGELPVDPPAPRIAANAAQIERLFAADTLEDIIAALAADPGEWAAKELAAIAPKAPLSSKVALRQLVEGAAMDDFASILTMEYRIASRLIMRPDFAEGVRALIVDKDNTPKWNPATPGEVGDELVVSIFAPLPASEEWTRL